eukprot:Rmarinus@m.215
MFPPDGHDAYIQPVNKRQKAEQSSTLSSEARAVLDSQRTRYGHPTHLDDIFGAFLEGLAETFPTLTEVSDMKVTDGIRKIPVHYSFESLMYYGTIRFGRWVAQKRSSLAEAETKPKSDSIPSLVIHLANDGYIYSDPCDPSNAAYSVYTDEWK